MKTQAEIDADWVTLRLQGADIWRQVHYGLKITFTSEIPPGKIRIIGKPITKKQNSVMTSIAKKMRDILYTYPETCTGSMLINVEYSHIRPAEPPDIPDITPTLPPQEPPSDNCNIYYV